MARMGLDRVSYLALFHLRKSQSWSDVYVFDLHKKKNNEKMIRQKMRKKSLKYLIGLKFRLMGFERNLLLDLFQNYQ